MSHCGIIPLLMFFLNIALSVLCLIIYYETADYPCSVILRGQKTRRRCCKNANHQYLRDSYGFLIEIFRRRYQRIEGQVCFFD